MLNKFKQFLNYQKPTPKTVFKATQLTLTYYLQRSRLQNTHKLKLIHLPYLLYLQKQTDLSKAQILYSTQLKLKLHKEKETYFQDMTELRYFIPDRKKILEQSVKTSPSVQEKLSAFWAEVKVEGPLYVMVPGTLQNVVSFLVSGKWMEKFAEWIVQYVNLYHKALQEMVEGHREVTRDHDTVLEDGKTVREKIQTFEQKLKNQTPNYEMFKNFKGK